MCCVYICVNCHAQNTFEQEGGRTLVTRTCRRFSLSFVRAIRLLNRAINRKSSRRDCLKFAKNWMAKFFDVIWYKTQNEARARRDGDVVVVASRWIRPWRCLTERKVRSSRGFTSPANYFGYSGTYMRPNVGRSVGHTFSHQSTARTRRRTLHIDGEVAQKGAFANRCWREEIGTGRRLGAATTSSHAVFASLAWDDS